MEEIRNSGELATSDVERFQTHTPTRNPLSTKPNTTSKTAMIILLYYCISPAIYIQ